MPVGLVLLAVAVPLTRAIGYGLGALGRGLLAPSERRRVMELERTRAGAVDAQAAELQRIERDLHDGAQARLVALAMDLGMAQEKFATDPEAAQELITGAHSEAKRRSPSCATSRAGSTPRSSPTAGSARRCLDRRAATRSRWRSTSTSRSGSRPPPRRPRTSSPWRR